MLCLNKGSQFVVWGQKYKTEAYAEADSCCSTITIYIWDPTLHVVPRPHANVNCPVDNGCMIVNYYLISQIRNIMERAGMSEVVQLYWGTYNSANQRLL